MQELMGYDEAAKFLTVSVRTLKSMVRNQQVPYVKVSSKIIRFNESALRLWLDRRSVPAVNVRPCKTKKKRITAAGDNFKKHSVRSFPESPAKCKN